MLLLQCSAYSIQSTATIMEISSVGRPTDVRTSNIVTRPADGTEAAPIDAAVAVRDTAMICPGLR